MPASNFPTAEPFLPSGRSLRTLETAARACQGCDLFSKATQTVFGGGSSGADIMLVGEQPGDKEDIAGEPFVGPAGMLLRDALIQADLGLERLYMTNAVKHFRFDQKGKRRQHRSPAAGHIAACKPWLRAEVEAVKPRLLVALGATALRAVSGKLLKVGENRGQVLESDFGLPVLVTVHPSSLIRISDRDERHAAIAVFVEELRLAMDYFSEPAGAKAKDPT